MKLYFLTRQKVFADSLKFYLSQAKPEWVFKFDSFLPEGMDCDLCLIDMMDFNNSDYCLKNVINNIGKNALVCLLGRPDLKAILQSEINITQTFPSSISGKVLFESIEEIHQSGKAGSFDDFSEEGISGASIFAQLTKRENQVLQHLKKGFSNKEISRALSIELVTVKLHVRGVCRKLKAENRTQAALLAQKWGV